MIGYLIYLYIYLSMEEKLYVIFIPISNIKKLDLWFLYKNNNFYC